MGSFLTKRAIFCVVLGAGIGGSWNMGGSDADATSCPKYGSCEPVRNPHPGQAHAVLKWIWPSVELASGVRADPEGSGIKTQADAGAPFVGSL